MTQDHMYSRGDLFWGSNDIAYGNEQHGHRPYLIVSNNKNNNYSSLLTVIPLTTQQKKPLPTHTTIYINNVPCVVLAEQLTCIRKIDVNKFIRQLTKEEMQEVEKCIKIQIAIYEGEKPSSQEKVKKQSIFAKIKAFFQKKRNKGRKI